MTEDRLTFLLFEPNEADARLVRELLHQASPFRFELTHVRSIEEAVTHLVRHEPDAFLVALDPSDDRGMDTVVESVAAAPETPIVVLTGIADESIGLRAVQAGAQDYLVKGELTGRLLVHSIRYAIERGRLEKERLQLLHREREARAAAESAVRSRDEVLAIVAHDLRNPLAAINTTVRLALDEAADADGYPQPLEVVLRSTEQMDRLIGDLLDVARIEGGTLRVVPVRTRPELLLAEIRELFGSRAAEAGLDLVIEAAPDALDVIADPDRVRQALANLVANAVRFTPRGGSVTVRCRPLGDSMVFSVTDTGVGIPAADLPNLFDRAWQTRHARPGGSGRGLAIARGIVEAHGGRIWAASEEGRGSSFYLTLPISRVGDGSAETVAPGERSGSAPAGSKGTTTPGAAAAPSADPITVVLVDDHAAIRHGLAEILRAAGRFRIVGECGTGEEALSIVERERPDVVVMDLAMPGMGGLEAARRITASMEGVRVLALTGENEEDVLIPVLRAGASGFVRKSTAHEDLVRAVTIVGRDEVFLYPSGNRVLLEGYLSEPDEAGPLSGLTAQEHRILRLAAEGFTSAEIGRQLYLSPKTVDTYRSRLMRRLGLSHRSDLVRFALRTGLLRKA
jgi:DNA-binding NarL/FixJ family response regulator